MANTKAKRGLVNPQLLVGGGSPHVETRKVSNAYATTFYPGMLVAVSANGFVKVKLTDANTSFLGVCQSYLPSPAGAGVTQVHEVQVVTDFKNTLWELQLSTAASGQTIIGNNVSLKQVTARDALSKQSRMYGGTPVTAKFPWKIVGFASDPSNQINNGSARVLVRLNHGTGPTIYHHYDNADGV